MTDSHSRQSGQIALIVLLILVVTFVVAVSLAQRTTEDITLSTKQAETTKVFSAAQTGAEQKLTEVLEYLRSNGTSPTPAAFESGVMNDSDFEVELRQVSEFTQSLDQGQTYQVNVPSSGLVTLEWGDVGGICDDEASILVGQYYESGGSLTVEYSGYYPSCGTNPHLGDGFQSANSGTSPRRNRITVSSITGSGGEFLRIIPLYAAIDLYVAGAADQQYVITSSATNQLGEEQESRVIEVTTSDYQPPSFLDYAVYSGTNLSK